jgi:hypothetical protein
MIGSLINCKYPIKKTLRLRWTLWLLPINVVAVILFTGCATPEQHSFNSEYNENLPVSPMYNIHDENPDRFLITVNQGKPSNGAERVINVKEAASTIAKAECKRLGWEKWDLNYIQERNVGWMHVVIAEVTRK